MAALYNRYIRGSDGGYTRVAQSDPPPHSAPPPPPGPDMPPPPPPPPRDPPPGRAPEMDLLNRLLARLHLGDLDSGDLLTLLLLFLVGDIFEKDSDTDHLAQLIVQGKLGGTEPAVFTPFQIGFFVMPGCAAGHDLEIVIPVALGQLGREKIGIALANQFGRGEGQIVGQQSVAGDEV